MGTMTSLSSLISFAFKAPGRGQRAVRLLAAGLFAAMQLTMFAGQAQAASRIKDIADFEGIRDNHLVGYGLVVGLNGTGDSLSNSPFTKQSLESMLERLGMNIRNNAVKTDNVAAVMVSATLPPFSRQGVRIDVSVSALGDSTSLLGGTLLVTPLLGADGEVYAVAQGSVAVGGFSASGQAGTVTKGVPTSGRIPNGGIVEREVGFDFASMKTLRVSLRNPDLTTARRMAQAINGYLKQPVARMEDPSTVLLVIPADRRKDMAVLLSELEQLPVEPDQIARVVIDEQNGIIVMGKDVKVDTVAISQGNLTVRVTETPQVSQPAPFSQTGNTTVVNRTNIQVNEDGDRKMTLLASGVSLQDLVDGLNALGIGPRDMISILQAIKAAGALQAEIEIL